MIYEKKNIDCFQNWALRTRAEETIIEVWVKLSELSAEKVHHGNIVAAINDAWFCHSDPDAIVLDAIDTLRQLTLLTS